MDGKQILLKIILFIKKQLITFYHYMNKKSTKRKIKRFLRNMTS